MSYPHSLNEVKENLLTVEQSLQYGFSNKELLIEALTHSSYVNEHIGGVSVSNQRLEFLGDSILNALVASLLFHIFPNHREGELSDLRAQLVDAQSCAHYLEMLGLQYWILMGRGQREEPPRSIAADCFEAILGAIFLDGGWNAAERFFNHHFRHHALTLSSRATDHPKARLQRLTQQLWGLTPDYRIVEDSCPAGVGFTMAVFVGDKQVGVGEGVSKKQAQVAAAVAALVHIEALASKNEQAL